jgi:hypothetical protein
MDYLLMTKLQKEPLLELSGGNTQFSLPLTITLGKTALIQFFLVALKDSWFLTTNTSLLWSLKALKNNTMYAPFHLNCLPA